MFFCPKCDLVIFRPNLKISRGIWTSALSSNLFNFQGSRSVVHGFHGSRWVLSFFMVPGWFFMVPGGFSWFVMVQGCFFMVPGGFLWFHVGFYGFMVPGWFFIFHVEDTPKLCSGPTIQSRPSTINHSKTSHFQKEMDPPNPYIHRERGGRGALSILYYSLKVTPAQHPSSF